MTRLLVGTLVLVVLIGGGVFLYLGIILKNGIENAGPRLLGTGVSVSSVVVSPFGGGGSISNLLIENPEGFNAPYVFEMGSMSIQMRVGSIFSDVIEIDRIIIDSPQITYENRLITSNIRTLINNLPGADSGAGDAEELEAGGGKRIIIRELHMLNPRVVLAAASVSAPLNLLDIELYDIGEVGNPVTIAEASRQILSAVNRAVLTSDINRLIDEVENTIRGGLQQLRDRIQGVPDDDDN